MEGMGLKFTLVVVRHLLGPLSIIEPVAGTLGLIASQNNPDEGFILLPAVHPPTPLHPSHPFSPTHPLICAICDITVAVKKLLKIQQC